MTAPLDPARYPVLLDEQCEVKVLLGKDQHTSVSTITIHLNNALMHQDEKKTVLPFRVTLFLSWFKTTDPFSLLHHAYQ